MMGLVGCALDADLLRRTFWTFLVWTDTERLHAFASGDPHRRIIARLRPSMGETRFATIMTGSATPCTWPQRKAPVT